MMIMVTLDQRWISVALILEDNLERLALYDDGIQASHGSGEQWYHQQRSY